MGTSAIVLSFLVLCICFLTARGGCNDFLIHDMPILFPSSKSTTKVVRIGAFGTFDAIPSSVPLLNFATNVINNSSTILPDVQIELYVAWLNKSSSNALLASQTLIDRYNVTALIGGLYSFETRIGQLVSRVYQIPEVAATPLSTLLSNKIEYPYLVRVIPPDQYEAQSIADMFRIRNWKQAMVFYCDDEFGTYGLSNMVTYTKSLNVTLYSNLITTGAKDFSSNVNQVKQLVEKYNLKIFIIYVQVAETNILLNQLDQAGLIGPSYFYIHTFASALSYLMTKNPPLPQFIGSVVTTPRGAVPGDLTNKFVELWERFGTAVANAQENLGPAWYYVDAIYLIATAIDNLIKSGTDLEHITGPALLKSISDVNFTGVTGRVLLDDSNERIGDYVWLELTENGLNLSDIRAVYDPITKNTTFLSTLSWNDGNSRPTDGLCVCINGKCSNDICICDKDYTGPLCEIYSGKSGLKKGEISAIVVVPTVIVIAITAIAVKINSYKRNKMIKDISDRQRSVIKRSDIALKDRIGRGASGEVFRGMLRGTEVAVKKIVTTSDSQEVAADFELECAIMAGLRHPNIVLFIGSCLHHEQNEMLLVMELMERGSLHDIIHNPKIKLSRDLLLNIAYQTAKGMNFLHQSSPPIIHRDLKSHNILMDDKWNARISDFGITKIKNLSTKKKDKENEKQKTQSLGTIYWTAPEVFDGYSHTEASDVYSFGIVLWEMFHRQTPYGGREPMSVAVEVVKELRPSLSPSLDFDIRGLIVQCWSGKPDARPNFETICNTLREMIQNNNNLNNNNNSNFNNNNNNTNKLELEAPTGGTAYFIFTEVEGSGELWDEIPMVMLKSLNMHNVFLRSNMEKFNGYEVEFNIQNGFFIAFRSLKDAMNFCISSQKELLQLEWPSELLLHPLGKTVTNEEIIIWKGLRVRMALHCGVSNCEVDKTSGRVKYFGPVIERTKKLLTITKKSYSIVTTAIIVDQCNKQGLKFTEDIIHVSCGEMMDTSRSKMENIYKIFPSSLVSRDNISISLKLSSSLPHSVVMIEEMENESQNILNNNNNINLNDSQLSSRSSSSSSRKEREGERPKWDISYSSLEEREKVGRGSTGDFIHCNWNGQDVAAKVLLNQKVEESDLLELKARASVLNKLKHKNLLDFHGVCLDEGHISVIVGYLPFSGLPSFLSDSSNSLSFKQKIKLLRQIAEGMDYLESTGHPWISTFSLKSPNILIIKEKMEIKICDFGQGVLRDLARTMTSVGTVAWTAPEILEGEEDSYSPKSTIYSFGIIMWEIMNRQIPYQDQHPIKVVSKILGGYRPIFSSDCPAAFKELAAQCWDRDPQKRPSWRNIITSLDGM